MTKAISVPTTFSVEKDGKERKIKNMHNGSVHILDRLFLSHIEAIERADAEIREAIKGAEGADSGITFMLVDKPKLPVILMCVEEWMLANMTKPDSIDQFPLSPRRATHELISFLYEEIKKVYYGELEVPNE